MSTSARTFNESFVAKLGTNEGQQKLSEFGGSYIKDRLREVQFSRAVLPPKTVTRADCQVSVNHDTLVKIVALEPKSRAMVLDFRGQPSTRYISGDRCEAAFFTVSSEIYQKTEQELLAYDFPLTKVIEENAVKDMGEIEDLVFIRHIESACQALQTEANGGVATALNNATITAGSVVESSIIKGQLARQVGAANDATVRPIQRGDFVGLFNLLDGNRLRGSRLLIGETDYNNVLLWTVDDNGDKIQSETTVEGYTYNKLLGRAFIRTIKTDILRRGNVYLFTSPEFLGEFFVLNNTKFYIDKKANLISFQAWEDIAMVIANIAGVRKLELYGGDANPSTNANGLLANFIPKEEEDLGAVNHRADQGLVFPQVSQF